MMRAKRLRVSLSPTRGSRGKGAWCYHRSHPPRHNGLSILRSKKVDIARGRVQRIPPVSVSNGLAVLLYQRLCDVTARPASCRGLAFGHFLGRCRPCTSASRLLGRRNCCHACRCTTRFDETKMRSSRGCFRSSARLCRSAQEARKSRSMCKHGPRSKLLQKRDLEPMRHLKPDEGGGDPVSVMLNGSGGFLSAAARTPTR